MKSNVSYLGLSNERFLAGSRCCAIAKTFLKTSRIILILLNKQDSNCLHNQAAQMLIVAEFQQPQVWHSKQHRAGLQCCVWDQNNRIVVTENKRAPQKCGKLSQHTKLFSRHSGKSCRPRTAWADVGTSAAQTAPLLCFSFFFFFHRSAASQRANKPFQSNGDWRLGCEPRLRCRPHFSSPQAPRGNYFCHVTLSHPPTFLIIPSSTTSVFPPISCSFFFFQARLIRCTPVDSHLPPDSPI